MENVHDSIGGFASMDRNLGNEALVLVSSPTPQSHPTLKKQTSALTKTYECKFFQSLRQQNESLAQQKERYFQPTGNGQIYSLCIKK